jgi:hypothetical protein
MEMQIICLKKNSAIYTLKKTTVRGRLGTLLLTLLITPNYSTISLDLHLYSPLHLWSRQPSPMMYGHVQTCTNICKHLQRPANISEGLRTSTKIPKVPQSSSEVFEQLWRPLQVHETLRLCLRTRRVCHRYHRHLPRSHTTPTKSCEVFQSTFAQVLELRQGLGRSPST